MPDLNLDVNYFDHPKTKRLMGLLVRGAEVLPIKLWAYCGKVHADTGRLSGYSARELESVIGWWGKEGEAAAGLVRVGFLREIPEAEGAGFEVVDWLEHQGHLAAFKRRARAAAAVRWNGDSNASSNAKPDAKHCPNQLDQPANQSNEEKPARERAAPFAAPSLEQVKAYCLERRNSVDAQKWHDHYTANGWMVGRTKMKDWKAAVRTWERGGVQRGSASARPVGEPGKYAAVGEHHDHAG